MSGQHSGQTQHSNAICNDATWSGLDTACNTAKSSGKSCLREVFKNNVRLAQQVCTVAVACHAVA